MTRSDPVRFVVAAAVGVSLALAIGAFAGPTGADDQTDTGTSSGIPEGQTPSSAPAPSVPPLPANATLQLVTYAEAPSGADLPVESASRLNAGIPRVPAITQFDGGPLANVNCAMASAAMLARLTFGIVTTGSQFRALQDDQEGGTSAGDVQVAVSRGWGVRFTGGTLSPLQLRALLYAGAGAEVAGLYSEIPESLRLQKGFTAGHSIYLDGFRETGPEGPAAYYVIDPLGHTWSGYRGAWWPADVIERFGTAFGSGRIVALWGFPGGTAPREHPILPPSAYPQADPGSPPIPSPGPLDDPMPTDDTGPISDVDQGTTPPDPPDIPAGQAQVGSPGLDSVLARCVAAPIPDDCPPGMIGHVVVPPGFGSTGMPASPSLVMRYMTQIGPGTWQLIYQIPPGATSDVWAWPEDGAQQISGVVETATLDGQPVVVATLAGDPFQGFAFVISARGGESAPVQLTGSVTVP